jgi:hypothetical protein
VEAYQLGKILFLFRVPRSENPAKGSDDRELEVQRELNNPRADVTLGAP